MEIVATILLPLACQKATACNVAAFVKNLDDFKGVNFAIKKKTDKVISFTHNFWIQPIEIKHCWHLKIFKNLFVLYNKVFIDIVPLSQCGITVYPSLIVINVKMTTFYEI